MPAFGPVIDNVGRIVPLRIGEIACGTTLEAVQLDGADMALTFELPESDLRWEHSRKR